MPKRYEDLITGEIYHVFNRTIGKEKSFHDLQFLERAFELIKYYRLKQTLRYSSYRLLTGEAKAKYLLNLQKDHILVDIYCYALMPNHYHFLLRQNVDIGIENFISNFQNSFAKYYNIRCDRNGGLFQERFKAKRIKSDEQLKRVASYIHLNPVKAELLTVKQLKSSFTTSFYIYKNKPKNTFVVTCTPGVYV